MSRETEVLRVFVASPSDLVPEREVVAKAAEELNKALGPGLGVRLEIVRCETHTYPALGSDPQDIVNRQIADDYEIFIGILWTRFGLPTPRADSGTLEEFNRAKARFEKDPGTVSVMFYFKDEPVAPSEIDYEQLGRVQRFRNDLAKEALFGTFNSEEDFGSNIRIHLTRVLLERKELRRRSLSITKDEPGVLQPSHPSSDPPLESQAKAAGEGNAEHGDDEEEEGDDNEEGLLDLIERGTTQLAKSTEIAQRMALHLNELTGHITAAGSDLQSVDTSKGGKEVAQAKAIINGLASKMNTFSDRMQAELADFGDIYRIAMRAFESASLVLPDFEGSEKTVADNLDAIRRMAETFPAARASMQGLKDSIERQPRITTEFNRAKRRIQKALGEADRQFSAAETLTREVIKFMEAQMTARENPVN